MTNERTILQLKPAPTTVPTSAAAPQSAEAVSPQAKPATDTRPEQQAMTGERTPELKPSPAGIAPPASTPAPQSAEAVGPQTNAPERRLEQRQAVTTPVTRPQPSPAQGGGTALRLDSEEITALIDRGSDLLKRDDLASARLLLRRAADAGSADAALMLGSTFDPLTIEQLGAIGVAPDVARARQWYQRAVELGSDAAAQRLANLKN